MYVEVRLAAVQLVELFIKKSIHCHGSRGACRRETGCSSFREIARLGVAQEHADMHTSTPPKGSKRSNRITAGA